MCQQISCLYCNGLLYFTDILHTISCNPCIKLHIVLVAFKFDFCPLIWILIPWICLLCRIPRMDSSSLHEMVIICDTMISGCEMTFDKQEVEVKDHVVVNTGY